jgi:RNA polymerase sigma factor (TIGR02999 family)
MSDITMLLRRLRAGDESAQEPLMEAVYAELHRMAVRIFRNENPGNSVQPTILIGDVWRRILHDTSIDWQDRAHFYRAAAKTMRNALVDYARSRNAQRRPRLADRQPLEDVVVFSEDRLDVLVDVHEALDRLAVDHSEAAEVVQLRYFGGYTLDEIADMLEFSVTTVKKRHEFAMSWLEGALGARLPSDV